MQTTTNNNNNTASSPTLNVESNLKQKQCLNNSHNNSGNNLTRKLNKLIILFLIYVFVECISQKYKNCFLLCWLNYF